MTFPLTIHLNSTRIGLAPNIFIPLICIEIFLHCCFLIFSPFIVLAIARSTLIHQNVRLLNISMIIHYIVFIISRFIVIYYELNDLPVTRSDVFIFTIDIIRDQFLGHFICQLGAISSERFIATRHWRWYERRDVSVVIVWILIEFFTNCLSLANVLLCVNGYYPHESNLIIFAEIIVINFAIYTYAYFDNLRILRSLNSFSQRYSVSHLFQVKENFRVLKFLLFFTITSLPFVVFQFSFFLVFFYAPETWDLERYLCMELFDFVCALYAPVYMFVGGRGIPEYRRKMYEIEILAKLAKMIGWEKPEKSEHMVEVSSSEVTSSYFGQLTVAWA